VKLWLDGQLSPDIAAWISTNFAIEAIAVRQEGLRDATDREIFAAASGQMSF
jgi:predicted nuclease of predicted toxin-antitoxin system